MICVQFLAEVRNDTQHVGQQIKNESLPSSAKVKNAWSYTSAPPYIFIEWCLVNRGICLHVFELVKSWDKLLYLDTFWAVPMAARSKARTVLNR